MREPHQIIVQPVVSEKTTRQMEEGNTYTFKVAGDANKIEVKRAIEKLFDVTVTDVRTMSYRGKAKRSFLGRASKDMGRRASFKKAVVTLAEGDHIELYEVG
jgi:large subunit ribosomal protein L23